MLATESRIAYRTYPFNEGIEQATQIRNTYCDYPNIITIITIARVFGVTNGSLGVCVYVVIDVNTPSKGKAWLCAKNTF